MKRLTLILVLLLSSVAYGQKLTGCTSVSTIPPPTIAPFSGFTGAGTYVANPEPANYTATGCFGFNGPLLRATDGNSAFTACANQGGACTGKVNRSMYAANSDGSDNHFTTNNEQFVLVDSGNSAIIYDNHWPLAPTPRYDGFPNFALGWGTTMPTASWTRAKNFLAFANAGGTANGTILSYYDTSTSWPTLPPRTTIIDFAASINGVPAGAINQTDPITCNKAETICGTGLSTTAGQGSSGACYVALWKQGFGMSVWNTCTGAVTGDFGTTGSASCVNCAGAPISPGTFTIHNVKWKQDMSVAIVQTTSSSCVGCLNQTDPYQWTPGTTTVSTSCPTPSSLCSGHFVSNGQINFINEFSTPSFAAKAFGSNTGSVFPVGTTCTQQHDQHASWNNDNTTDTQPFFVSNTWDTQNPTYTSCNVDEIDAIDPPTIGDNKVFRYAHTYGAAVTEFAGRNQLAVVSSDGKFVLMTSPMANSSTFIGQLGDTSGNFPCTTQGPCRSDVFMLGPVNSTLLFGSSWNSVSTTPPPPTWPPTDSTASVVPIGNARMWDGGMKWSQIETANGTYNWAKMDVFINTLIPQVNMQLIYTVGSMPKWASTCSLAADPSTCLPGAVASGFGGGTQCASPSDYSCLPPSDVASNGTGTDANYQNFISTLITRYAGKIRYYENWNEQDSPNFWCPGANGATGCPATTAGAFAIAVRMNWDQWNIVHCLDPNAQVLSPSFHGFSSGAGAWMNTYSNTSISAPAGSIAGCSWGAQTVTGKQTFDITNFHNHSTSAENLISTYNGVSGEITRDNLPTAVFADEIGCSGLVQCINQDTLASYVARTYLICITLGPPSVQECNYYQWDSGGGVALQGTIAGLAYNTTENWLLGAVVGTRTLVGSTYSIPITSPAGVVGLIVWDTSKNCTAGCTTGNQSFGAQYTTYQDITGTTFFTTGGNGTAPVGLKPIYLSTSVITAPPTNFEATPGVQLTSGTRIN